MPTNQKILQDISFLSRREFLAAALAMNWSIHEIGLSRYTNQLVLRPTLRAVEILVLASLVHGALVRSERFQQDM
jgi:hypothetical protein